MALVTLNFESAYLNQAQYITVILPDKPDGKTAEEFYSSGEKYKVLWLLHGTYGIGNEWLRRTKVELYASKRNMIVVMPDALNSDFVAWPEFGMGYDFPNYFVKELMPLIHHWFPASDKKEDNFIAGLSMGGQGATQLGFMYPDKFAKIGAFSYPLINYHKHDDGDVFNGEFPEYTKRFFTQVKNQGGMEAFMKSPYNTWDMFFENPEGIELPPIHFFIGKEDFFWPVHLEMKRELKKRGRTDVEITEYPKLHHEWEVWDRAVHAFIDECDPDTIGAGFRY
ncbi:MAG: hypothetical protein IJ744_02715 [Lachnospiraceae bacterium]|nr:hypothetical protein [Lachnospiraceae bacterium]